MSDLLRTLFTNNLNGCIYDLLELKPTYDLIDQRCNDNIILDGQR